ncbi:MAG: hypothetical protein K2X39_02415, partial [Silvanigrellaceae bacterium]|nr:hypothetical protein [Silvanigrellaceae bacterium]
MGDVRVNGKRVPPLQTIDILYTLMSRLDTLGKKNGTAITSLMINGSEIDLENQELRRMKLETEDKIDVRMETPEQLAFESLAMAQDMANLLIFDIKVTTIALWDSSKTITKSLETLLNDCKLFLSLGAKPVYLLDKEPTELEESAQRCLKQLDQVASYLEDATLLTINNY